jgi:hypothetical protein
MGVFTSRGLGAQAGVVSRQAARSDDPPDDWFGRAEFR